MDLELESYGVLEASTFAQQKQVQQQKDLLKSKDGNTQFRESQSGLMTASPITSSTEKLQQLSLHNQNDAVQKEEVFKGGVVESQSSSSSSSRSSSSDSGDQKLEAIDFQGPLQTKPAFAGDAAAHRHAERSENTAENEKQQDNNSSSSDQTSEDGRETGNIDGQEEEEEVDNDDDQEDDDEDDDQDDDDDDDDDDQDEDEEEGEDEQGNDEQEYYDNYNLNNLDADGSDPAPLLMQDSRNSSLRYYQSDDLSTQKPSFQELKSGSISEIEGSARSSTTSTQSKSIKRRIEVQPDENNVLVIDHHKRLTNKNKLYRLMDQVMSKLESSIENEESKQNNEHPQVEKNFKAKVPQIKGDKTIARDKSSKESAESQRDASKNQD